MSRVYETLGILAGLQAARESSLKDEGGAGKGTEAGVHGAPVVKVWVSPRSESLSFATDKVC